MFQRSTTARESTLKDLCIDDNLIKLKERVKQGEDILIIDHEGNSLTHTATFYGRSEILKWLISEKKISPQKVNTAGKTILQIALEKQQLAIIEWLIDNNNIPLTVTISDLHLAIKTKDLPCVKRIAKVVSDISKLNDRGKSIIELARVEQQPAIESFLVRQMLHYILKQSWSEEYKLVRLKQHLDNVSSEQFGSKHHNNAPIILAARKGHFKIIKWLIGKGADPNSKDESGNSLLAKISTHENYPEVFKWLVNNGADIKSLDEDGNFALDKFVQVQNIDMLRWSIQEKNFNILEKNIITSAVKNNKKEVVKFLIDEAKLDTNMKLDNNRNLLHLAASSRAINIVRLLLNSNTDIIEDQNGKTPIDIAKDNMYESIKAILIFKSATKILEDPNADQQFKIAKLNTLYNSYGRNYVNIRESFNGASKTIIDIAKERKLDKIEKFLNFTYAENILSSDDSDIFEKLRVFFYECGYIKKQEMKLSEVTESTATSAMVDWVKRNYKTIAVIEATEATRTSNLKEYNVLLLGETGVGKSTFINAFANYINFTSLDEASASDNIYNLIPSSFIITDENYDRKLIKFGEDKNESFKTGESSTQSARNYSIQTDTAILRIIDTPGIGDTRGIEKDQENFDKLLRVIGELENIHAICIMLKPNSSRLNVLFEYCIKGIFSHLDKSASKNIVFLFTNSRGTFYRPGDTLPPLLSVLKDLEKEPTNVKIPFGKDNVFCMDNEAFRFLLAKKQVAFSDAEKQDFSASWEKSSQICLALTRYLVKLKPHNIQSSVSINAARRLSLALSKPLAEVAKNISENLVLLQKKEEQIERNKDDLVELKKHLQPEVGILKLIRAQHPYLACMHKDCLTWHQEQGIRYETERICYDPCLARHVVPDIKGHLTIRDCPYMRVRCQTIKCGHSYLCHIRRYTKLTVVSEKVKDLNFDNEISKKILQKEDIENILQKLKNAMKEYQNEVKQIIQAMAKFSHFLSHNSIIRFDDICESFIQDLIEREKKLADLSNSTLLKAYQNMKQNYKKYLNDLEIEYKAGNVTVTPYDVLKEESNLYKLKRVGDTIHKISEAQLDMQKKDVLPDKVILANKTFSDFITSVQ